MVHWKQSSRAALRLSRAFQDGGATRVLQLEPMTRSRRDDVVVERSHRQHPLPPILTNRRNSALMLKELPVIEIAAVDPSSLHGLTCFTRAARSFSNVPKPTAGPDRVMIMDTASSNKLSHVQ